MPKKVLVTGAPGWLGTPFVELLCKKNYEVKCLVLDGFDTTNLEELGVEVVRGDVTNPESLKGIAKGVDTVFHAVGVIHPRTFRTNDWSRINYWGLVNVLRQAVKVDVPRLVYVSSNSVGGTYFSLMNEFTPPSPYMGYGRSKLRSENLLNYMFTHGKIETVILRPCWFYGAGQPKRQTQLMGMIQNQNVPLLGNGLNLRSMTYIGSLCEALILAGEVERAKGETYWIADERPYTTLEIYQTIADILGVELKYIKLPNLVSEISMIGDWVLQHLHMYQQELHVVGEINKNIACSVEKAKKDLGFKPRTYLREGMEESIEWCRQRGLLK